MILLPPGPCIYLIFQLFLGGLFSSIPAPLSSPLPLVLNLLFPQCLAACLTQSE